MTEKEASAPLLQFYSSRTEYYRTSDSDDMKKKKKKQTLVPLVHSTKARSSDKINEKKPLLNQANFCKSVIHIYIYVHLKI